MQVSTQFLLLEDILCDLFIYSPRSAIDVKQLYDQQQKLQATTSRIEKKLDEIKQTGHVEQEASGVNKSHIPRHLSVSIKIYQYTPVWR